MYIKAPSVKSMLVKFIWDQRLGIERDHWVPGNLRLRPRVSHGRRSRTGGSTLAAPPVSGQNTQLTRDKEEAPSLCLRWAFMCVMSRINTLGEMFLALNGTHPPAKSVWETWVRAASSCTSPGWSPHAECSWLHSQLSGKLILLTILWKNTVVTVHAILKKSIKHPQ